MNRIEILAPAGGFEHLISAVRSGADAVYLGTKSFNARAGAVNFDGAELVKAVSYAHARGVKVHVTLNTLVTDEELPLVKNTIKEIAYSGADAVIVQDLGVARLVRECCPSLCLHASTQMAIHNLDGALVAKELGFSRVVLSRELSFEEIKYITDNCGVETEVFVHGALCMSVSGCCYLSSVLGERSGNRGRCAGPCRLNFKSGEREYALSLKDMSHIQYINELEKAGVCSLKIEGRLKRPEYVAAAVDACLRSRESMEYDEETLRAAFSRGGFTDGYYNAKRTTDMFGVRSEDDVVATKGVLGKIAELTRLERSRVPIDMRLSIEKDKPSELIVTDKTNSVTVKSRSLPEEAKTRATDVELARRNLEKTGGTPFFLNSLSVTNNDGLFVSPSEINELRRSALEAMLTLREQPRPKDFIDYELPKIKTGDTQRKPTVYVFAETASQADAVTKADRYALPVCEIVRNPSLIEKYKDKLAAVLPTLDFHVGESKTAAMLKELSSAGLEAAVVQNIGALYAARKSDLYLIGGHGLNITNSLALSEYTRLGLDEATASFELSLDRIRRLSGARIGILAYGRLPLMLFRNCPGRSKSGCGECNGHASIVDRKGNEFPLLCHERSYSVLLNPIKLYMSNKNLSGVDFTIFSFTDETPKECSDAARDYEECSAPPSEHTNGLYFRELQ